jgi:hypothetical protein
MHLTRAGWLALAAAVLAVMAAPATARGDAVTQWNINTSNAILAANPTAHSQVLSFAMVQGAVYDAVNGIAGGYTPYARLFAMVALASADGAIGCWNDKYYWNFWRPIDAIRLADTDGNPATEADTTWRALFDPATAATPPVATPNFPDHPSGHNCLSSAVLNVLRDFFGTDRIAFDIVSTRFPGTPLQTRHFRRFSQALGEIIDARVWGGIHFRTADVQGAVLGRKVADWERAHFFLPTCQALTPSACANRP